MSINTWISGTNGGLLRVQSDGSYEWNPNGDFDGLALGQSAQTAFDILVEDGDRTQRTATLNVTVSNHRIDINVASGNEVALSVPSTMNDTVPVTVVAAPGSVGDGTYTFTAAQIRQAAPLYFPGTASVTLEG